MMYYFWKKGRIRPSVFYSMPKGELIVLEAFFQKEIDEKNELLRQSEGKMFCPMMFQ